MEPQNLVKKRGRKPKQKYIVNDNPIFDNNNSEQIIINIKKKKTIDYNILESDNISSMYNIDDIDR